MNLVIVGAGGFGREVMQYACDCIDHGEPMRIRGFVDDSPEVLQALAQSEWAIGSIAKYQPAFDDRVVIAIGEPVVRLRVSAALASRGAKFATLRHPLCYVAASATVEEGCILAPFSFVGPGASLMRHVVLNTYASVGHDARIGECTVLSPYSAVNGAVSVGGATLFGSGAMAVIGSRVGEHAKVAAGSIVYNAVPDFALAVGNPAISRVMFRSTT